MSAAPPPPPPYPTSAPVPPRTDGGWDRRALRQQRRAAKLQFRQQISLQRAQLRAARRTSILGPSLLLGLGVVFLLVELGRIQTDAAVAWLGHWWPLVLVAAGFVLLLEWAADTWISTQRGTPALPRRVGAGTSFLLVLLILLGAALLAVQNRPNWIAQNWTPDFADSVGLEQLFAPHHETVLEMSAPLASKGLLTVQNFRGTITVRGVSQDGQVHISARQRLSAWQRSDLRGKQERDRPSLQQTASGLLLQVQGEDRDRTDLAIEVPHDSALVIQPERGELTVAELRGPLTVNDHTGNITLTALAGSVHLTVADDNATVNGHSLTGDLNLEGRTGDLSLSDVTGPVTLHGDFFGTTHLEHIKGPLHFQSSFTDLACRGIPGELNVDGRSDLEATDIDGPVTLHTTDRNIRLSGVSHGATIEDRNGSITLALTDPIGPVKATTTNGAVDLRVPEGAAFALSADTLNGQISNDLGLSTMKQDDRTSLAGKVHTGGPEFFLNTSDGDIRIHKGATIAAEGERANSRRSSSNTDSDDSQD